MSSPQHLQSKSTLAASSEAGRRMLAVGRVHLWQGGSLWIGRGHGRSDWHDHHALQIAVALDGVCLFRDRVDGTWAEFRGAIVRSHRPHQFEVEGATMAQLFIEPETVEGRRLRERFVDDISPLPEAQRRAMAQLLGDALRSNAQADEMIAAARAATLLLAGVTDPIANGDARIDQAMATSDRTSTPRSRSAKPRRRQASRQVGSATCSSRRRARAFVPMCSGRD